MVGQRGKGQPAAVVLHSCTYLKYARTVPPTLPLPPSHTPSSLPPYVTRCHLMVVF